MCKEGWHSLRSAQPLPRTKGQGQCGGMMLFSIFASGALESENLDLSKTFTRCNAPLHRHLR